MTAATPPYAEMLIRLAALLEIAHHVPGRIRLRLAANAMTAAADALADARKFGAAVHSIPGIHAVNLNALARSCVVEYDPARIPPKAWTDLMNGIRSPDLDTLLSPLTDCLLTA